MSTTFVSLHNKSCLSCGHLVDKAREFHDSCHFTNGNAGCPARNFKIGIGVDQERASQAIAEALHNEDAGELLRLATKLNKLNPVVSRSVMSKVFNKFALLNGISVSDIEEEDEDEDGDVGGEGEQDAGDESGDAEGAKVSSAASVSESSAQPKAQEAQTAVAPVKAEPEAAVAEDSEDASAEGEEGDDEDEWVN